MITPPTWERDSYCNGMRGRADQRRAANQLDHARNALLTDLGIVDLGWIGWSIRLGPVALYVMWEVLGANNQADMIRLMLHALLIGLAGCVLCAWIGLRAALMFPQTWDSCPRAQGALSSDDAHDGMQPVVAGDEAC